MKKILIVFVASVLAVTLAACGSKGSDTIKGTYSIIVTGYDWGAGVNRAIISLDYEIDSIKKSDLNVKETKMATDFTKSDFPINKVTAAREITKVYLSDADGKKVSGSSKYITVEMAVDPNTGSPLLYSMHTQFNTWSDPYQLTFTLSDSAKLKSNGTTVKSFKVDKKYTKRVTSVDEFKTDSFKASDGVKYNYSYYEPEEKSDTLVVWLHGMGEGGTKDTDPSVILLANEAGNLAKKEFQSAVGGAYVLVPQCPTFWMDPTGKGLQNGNIVNDGTSYYTKSLTELIKNYKKKTGVKKIVLAGCSNGGFMTMIMAITNPDMFTAYVPICEALADKYVTDDNINTLKDLNMYFIYSKADTTVDPTQYEEPTIARLQAAGAKKLQVSVSEKVVDTSGKYKDESGNAYTYNGHWSWIYFFNNEADTSDGTKVFAWIKQTLK